MSKKPGDSRIAKGGDLGEVFCKKGAFSLGMGALPELFGADLSLNSCAFPVSFLVSSASTRIGGMELQVLKMLSVEPEVD